jgi:hypothetical protein
VSVANLGRDARGTVSTDSLNNRKLLKRYSVHR